MKNCIWICRKIRSNNMYLKRLSIVDWALNLCTIPTGDEGEINANGSAGRLHRFCTETQTNVVYRLFKQCS